MVRGDPAERLPELADDRGARRVVWGRDHTGLARERDARVGRALDAAGVAWEAVSDAFHHEPGSITTNEGAHYSVFSHFWSKWRDREKAPPVDVPDALADVTGDPLDFDPDEPEADVPELRAADTDAIHEWPDFSESERDRAASGYPGPIVDHGERRDAAIAAFEAARGDE